MKPKLNKILKNNKALFLAYDQGMEHGPDDFNGKNVDPLFILDIAKRGGFTGVVFQKGIAEKYSSEIKKSKVPLIIKLNGKTNLVKGEPVSRQLCNVKEAIELGASAVGYTIYIGSEHESTMMQEFSRIERETHSKGLPVILWAYPRGKSVKGKNKGKLMAYACRVGLELGADIIKVVYNGKPEDLKWAVENAGRCKVVVAGGVKKNENLLLKQIKDIIGVGCVGLAIGRNVWQSKEPLVIAKKIRGEIIK